MNFSQNIRYVSVLWNKAQTELGFYRGREIRTRLFRYLSL